MKETKTQELLREWIIPDLMKIGFTLAEIKNLLVPFYANENFVSTCHTRATKMITGSHSFSNGLRTYARLYFQETRTSSEDLLFRILESWVPRRELHAMCDGFALGLSMFTHELKAEDRENPHYRFIGFISHEAFDMHPLFYTPDPTSDMAFDIVMRALAQKDQGVPGDDLRGLYVFAGECLFKHSEFNEIIAPLTPTACNLIDAILRTLPPLQQTAIGLRHSLLGHSYRKLEEYAAEHNLSDIDVEEAYGEGVKRFQEILKEHNIDFEHGRLMPHYEQYLRDLTARFS